MRNLFSRLLLALTLLAFVGQPMAASAQDTIARAQAAAALKEATQRAPAASVPDAQSVYMGGDSLIAGTGSTSSTVPNTLAALSGATVLNRGIGGQTSTQIAKRMGAIPTTLTFASNSLGVYVATTTVTAIDGAAPAAATSILSTPADTLSRELTGTVTCGGIGYHGTLLRRGNEAYSFRSDSLAGAVSCGPNALFTPDMNWGGTIYFEMGRNDYSSAATVQANIAAVFAKCDAAGGRCFWLDILTGAGEGVAAGSGHAAYVAVTGINAWAAAAYPGRVLPWRAFLVSKADLAQPTDVTAKADDQVPPSLQSDSVHLTAAAYALTGAWVYGLSAPTFAARAKQALTVDSLNAMFNRPLALGSALSIGCGTRATTDGLEVCGKVRLGSNQPILGVDGSGNVITLMQWDALNSYLSLGGANLQQLRLGVNGAFPALTIASNVGDLQVARSYQDRSYSYQTPAAAATVTMADTSDLAIIDPAGTLTSLTIKLPTCSATYDGKSARFLFAQSVTSLTVTATAGAISSAPGSANANTHLGWLCRGASTTWYRLQ